MRYGLRRIPIPLILAAAVAVGAAITIIIQITILPPPSAVVAPIELPDASVDSGSITHTISVEVPAGRNAVYITLAGLGKLTLESNTTGWYYFPADTFAIVVRRNTGNVTFTLSGGARVHVWEINNTHAFIFYTARETLVMTKKVQVARWIVYHPTITTFDTNTVNIITRLLVDTGRSYFNVVQPREDYVLFDLNTRQLRIYTDTVYRDGTVRVRNMVYVNTTRFTPISPNSAVVVDRMVQIDTYNYVLFPVWLLFYYQPTSGVSSSITIGPTQ